MTFFEPITYTQSQLRELEENEIVFPFNDEDAVYKSKYHQYELTEGYFIERGINLRNELAKLGFTSADSVKQFLAHVRTKFYLYAYHHSKSTMPQINYLIAKRGLRTFPNKYEYRIAVLEAMFQVGEYLLNNGDVSQIAGLDLDTMTAMPIEQIRYEERDYPQNFRLTMSQLGLSYYGRYTFLPTGIGKEW